MVYVMNKFHIWQILNNSILISIVLFHFSCGEKSEVHISQTIMFEGKLYLTDSKDPFSGIIYNTYPDGQREYAGEYKVGQPNGLLVYWYENGNKMREGKLKGGTPVGRWVTYKEDGSVKETIDH